MSALESTLSEQIEETQNRGDGISIRTFKEQDEYIKSQDYQKVIADLEELKNRRETKRERALKRMKDYNKERYRLEKTIRKNTMYRRSKYIKSNIPKITLSGKIIHPEK